ncbi:hypothetical protein [Amycolatopsis panacis]|uniref:Uncharacterized protein n=1 Tax=Amycolatopsis panacis TaxID=2340917 RepID=A0A419HZ38_9PSEU|nr:hypothetical protein [Amycolatopsis panacis]RJQ82492.1 hypothetical protein D5S19_21860 [Amycolatopsis panacis]
MSRPHFPAEARRGRRCEHCGRHITPGRIQVALVPDPSAVDFTEYAMHGRRLVYACCDEHLTAVVERAHAGWSEAQWWFELLSQASLHPSLQDATVERIAREARLAPEQLHAAMTWNSRRTPPHARLPGGQILPVIPDPRKPRSPEPPGPSR